MDPGSSEPSPADVRRYRRAVGTAAKMTVEVYDDRAHVDGDGGVDHDRLGRLGLHTLAHVRVPPTQVDVTLVDPPAMAALNAEHMGSQGPTDVLAFPLEDFDPDATPPPTGIEPARGVEGSASAPSLLGDVVLCPAVAAAQAADGGHSAAAELDLLLVHGILHLLGHDHAEEGERARMFSLTDEILAGFGTDVVGAEGPA